MKIIMKYVQKLCLNLTSEITFISGEEKKSLKKLGTVAFVIKAKASIFLARTFLQKREGR